MTTHPRGQYRQVADTIREGIMRGAYPRGVALPREDEIATELDVNRATVNRALRILAAEGLVRAVRGKGTIVVALPVIERNAVARYSRPSRERAAGRGAFDSEIRSLGMTSRSDVRVERATPPEHVADILAVSPDEISTVVRRRKMYADDTPVQLADSYIPIDIAAGTALEEQDTGPGGLISRMAELGHAQVRITERVAVRPPTPEEASFLDLSEDHRVYVVTHVGWTAENRAVEVCLHIMPTHRWLLDYEWQTDRPTTDRNFR